MLGVGSARYLAKAVQTSKYEVYLQQGKHTVIIGRYGDFGFGDTLASGDLNGDGFEDLIVGAKYVSSETHSGGEVYVLLGPLAFGQSITMPQQAALVFKGTGTGQPQLGSYLASGDLNGDGYDDIVMGTSPVIRRVYAFLGSPAITTTLPLTVPATSSTMALTVLHPDLGAIVCNMNGDVYDDLIIESSQQVWGILGSPQLNMSHPLTINVATDPVDFTIVGFEPESWATPSPGNLGCGDVDGDGYNDLVVGAYGESPNGHHAAGNVYVIRGSSEITYGRPITIQVHEQADAIIEGLDGAYGEGGDWLGRSLTVADVNDDGRADLILGAPYGDGPNNSMPSTGEVYLWLGRELYGQKVDLNVEAEWVLYGDAESSVLGKAVSTGDFDCDGRAEVLLGCQFCNQLYSPSFVSGSGYVIDADQIQGTHTITQAATLSILPSVEYSYVGNAVIAFDSDADEYEDVVLANMIGGDNQRGIVFVVSYPIRFQLFLPLVLRQSG